MKLKSWEKHIVDTSFDEDGKEWCGLAWCGASARGLTFAFTSIDHAVMNARNEGRLLPCPACLKVVRDLLATQVCDDTTTDGDDAEE